MRFKLVEQVENEINENHFKGNLSQPLLEAKADIEKLKNAVGDELAQQFLDNRQRFKSPYNDIYYWIKRSPEELQDYLDNFQSSGQKDREAKEGVKVIYKDNDWLVMDIQTYEASAKYGAMTRWCISGTRTYKSGKTGRDYFNQYTKDYGTSIYFYISKKYGKFALVDVHNGWCQIFNDQDITVDDIPNKPSIPELDRLTRILLDRIYEDDTWTVDAARNTQFAGQFIIENKNDDEEAYKFVRSQSQFIDPSGRPLSIQQFIDKGEEYEDIYMNCLRNAQSRTPR